MLKKSLHYLKIYHRLPIDFKRLLWQAAWQSLIVECQLQLRYSKAFKTYQDNLPETMLTTSKQKRQVLQMTKVMRMLEQRAPWTPMCLNRAVVSKKILRKQGIETTIHVGFKPRESTKEFEGHAWLTIGHFFITGHIPQLKTYQEMRPVLEKG